ncbi:hypothetical protein [Priestia koreensis]|uniref:Uncharacterized protein n=1 Tax=Priestia koreensis TaxID=284581 RepID=A0A0M0L4X5_9BACI|nr:hypothetical protein [Priestia koreensis]KOO46116.1 hypothetical protein AMD01_09600 [Priestia koreensis]
MSSVSLLGVNSWINVASAVLLVIGFYFTLSFLQALKEEDVRVTKQLKLAAVTCIGAALLAPALYQLYIYFRVV